MATKTSTSKLAQRWADAFRKMVGCVSIAAFAGITPVPAARPRVSKWGTYYPKTYTEWMKSAGEAIKLEEGVKIAGPCVLYMEHVLPAQKTSKTGYPRGDVDNFCKGGMDVITKSEKFWDDDTQVVGLVAFKRFSTCPINDPPGTRVLAAPLPQE